MASPARPSEAPTPYISPEQVQGGAIDRRTDVYALGVLLYTLLVGEAPPAGVVASPRAKRPDLPESIDRVVFKALAQNPDARFQSPVEFRNALDLALRPVAPTVQPTPVQPAATSQATPPPAKKSTNWMTITLVGVVVVAVVCLCAVALGLVMDGTIARSTPAPTQPIEVTVVLPTNEPRPTKPEQPAPTEPPELPEPTAPPIEPPPTEPVEPAPTEPGEQPDQGLPPSGNLPDLCGSAGFIGGAAILGGVRMTRKRRK